MSTITTLASGDDGSISRGVINTNFSNLNTDKVEGPASSTDTGVPIFNGTGGKTLKTSGIKVVTNGSSSWFEADITSADNENGDIDLTAKTSASGVGGDTGLYAANSTAGNNVGGDVVIVGGNGFGSGIGGQVFIGAGRGGSTGIGGGVTISSADGGATSGQAGRIDLVAGSGVAGNSEGGGIDLISGDGFGSGAGGFAELIGGTGGATGEGGSTGLYSGIGGATSGAGGDSYVSGGYAQGGNSNGGKVYLQPGNKTGSGTNGFVYVLNPDTRQTTKRYAVLDTTLVTTSDKTFTFPNYTGTLQSWVAVPASAGATGVTGSMAYASGFLYVCVATNTWQRVAIATW